MPSEKPTANVLANCLVDSLRLLANEDGNLLKANVHERTLTHCIAVYLRQALTDWHVDVEYNRDVTCEGNVKKLPPKANSCPNAKNSEPRPVFPDIIVHHRDTDKNLLVIEAKKSSSTQDKSEAVRKLEAFTQGHLNYSIGVFLRIPVEETEEVQMEFYSNGKQVEGVCAFCIEHLSSKNVFGNAVNQIEKQLVKAGYVH